ncbi:hypothetical protein CYMTET_48412 [Cymbomonas tetramitiformis]|uniref:Chromo domain-containing protein n=1 Tax=Cymbomonas tetramitiformis TaxID=36881 RepID=A0AAE0BSF3_9CHLO|nr:hypothetical protein CYMTET_48412 [Cymbomonas tetramitiformis]
MGGKRGRGPKRASSSGVTLKAQGKGLVKRTQQPPFDPAGSDSVDYVVSEIKAERLRGAISEWLIGLEGFSDKEDTWEPIDHLVGHEHDIAVFRERRKLEAAKEEAEAAKKKSERQAEIDLAAEDADGFEESSGGKRRSPCWKYFKILRDDNNGKIAFVKCTLCPAENKAIPFSGNTTNLRTHPSLVHKDEYCRMLGSNLSTATEESNRSTSSKGTIDARVPQLVVHHILALSAEGKERLAEKLKVLLEEGIMPSIGGDIWSQGEYVAGGDVDVAPSVDTVSDFIHATCSDNASNIVSGWTCFDGHECADHTIALTVKTFLEQPGVKKVFMKLRGMTTHFNHSVIGAKLLKQCQDRHKMPESKPPQDNDTRSNWGGAYHQAVWHFRNQVGVQIYDVENPKKAATAVPNPDGSVYKSHQLVGHEWDIVRESMYILMYAKHAVDLLQGTKYVTASLFYPVAGRLGYIAHEDTCLKYEGQTVLILNEDVKQARQSMHPNCCRRFFNQLLDCKLEDFAVSTLLDPRYKSFKFKYCTQRNGCEVRAYALQP